MKHLARVLPGGLLMCGALLAWTPVVAQDTGCYRNDGWKGLDLGEVAPRIRGAYTSVGTKPGGGELCVLILWRGEPGWYSQRNRAIDSLRSRGFKLSDARPHTASEEPILNEGFRTYGEDLGDVFLSFDYQWGHHRVQILGQRIELGANNVVLIDRADGSGGKPFIYRMLRIDPAAMPGDSIPQFVARSAVLRDFVAGRETP